MTVTFDTVETIAAVVKTSKRSIHELTRTNAIPHRKLPGQRRILFVREEVEKWIVEGCPLEVIELAGGGRVVRPAEPPA